MGGKRWFLLTLLLTLVGCGLGDVGGGASHPKPLYASRPDGVYLGGAPLALFGLNWFGLETCDRAPHGLWSGRSVSEILAQVRGYGFNALRLPVGPEVLRDQGNVASWAQLGDPAYPTSPLAGLRYLLGKAQGLGFYVLLDLHTFRCDLVGPSLPGRPFDPSLGYTKADWLEDLRRLARLSLEFPQVFGIDLFNEPHGLTWAEWRSLAQEGAQAVLAVNPRILVAVEGVGNASDNGGYPAFWGGNLAEARDDLGLGDRLLYLPHVYGPSVHAMPYFSDPAFPENLPAIWEAHFGHLSARGLPWGIGEFGGSYTGQDRVWQDRFVQYLRDKGVRVWFYWALNPNSGDTGGILQEDWLTPVGEKLDLLRRLMPPPSGTAFDFLPAEGEVVNPERGFAADSYYPDEPTLDPQAKLAEARALGFEVRLIRRTYYLHAFAGQDTLPQAFLDTLAQDLAGAQAAGVKLILRFAYRPDENRQGGPTYCNPPKERILAHLAQLGPVLRQHLGVIAYLEAGLIGP
ncbi:MAG: cellulase family glycosylhydrolase, partial [Thermus sp.]